MLISPMAGLVPGRECLVDRRTAGSRGNVRRDAGDGLGRRARRLAGRARRPLGRSASPRVVKTLPTPEMSSILYSHRSMSEGELDAYAPPPDILRAAFAASSSTPSRVLLADPPGYRPPMFRTPPGQGISPDDYALAYDSSDSDLHPHSEDELMENGSHLLYTVGDAVEYIGAGRMQWILLFAMALHALLQGMDITFLTVLPTLADCDLHLSSLEKALISTVFFLGVTIGAFSIGFVGDRFGRNRALQMATTWTVVVSTMAMLTYNYAWLLVFRFMVGLGIGGFALRNALLFEFLPTSFRVKSTFLLLVSWAGGTVLEIPVLIIPHLNWRYIMAVNHLGHVIVIACLLYIPESPRFLLNAGLNREAKACLRRIAAVNNARLPPGELVSEEEKEAILQANNVFSGQTTPSQKKDSFLGLYRTKALCTTTILLNIIWFSLFFAEYGMYFFSAELLKGLHGNVHADASPSSLASRPVELNVTAAFLSNMTLATAKSILNAGFGVPLLNITAMETPPPNVTVVMENVSNTTAADAVYHCNPLTGGDYLSLFATFMGSFPGIILFFWVMDLVGRRTAIAINSIAAAAFIVALMIPKLTRVSLTVILACLRAVLTAAFKILLVYTPEVYPTAVRSRGVGFQVAVGRLGAVVTPFVAQVLLTESLLAGEFVYVVVCILAAVLALLLPIETKGAPLPE